MPSQPRPIMIIGTGGIVKDAHLPAYRKAGFTVAGLYDHDRARAEALASEWGIDTVFDTLEQAAAADAAFDVAAPPVAHVDILSALPEGAAVLLQKPMGQIGRAHVCTPVTNAQLVFRLMLQQKTDDPYVTLSKTIKQKLTHM